MRDSAALQYSRTHEWIRQLEDGAVLVGLTDYALEQLGEPLFVDLPAEGAALRMGQPLCEVESIAAVFSVSCPVSGVVSEVNEALLDAPERLAEDPYGSWIARFSQAELPDGLMDGAAYQAFIQRGV